ncbi:hypothetical protein FRC03_011467 [Tulasnella sp. 419]|nr:hypothetical protein FRC02_007634 [Tulasnella sp. 418]KAG8954527.1 hypothetical protein FRC03_011467 [Tulasnella sp. 419]
MSNSSTATPAFDPAVDSPYNYIPTTWVCALFIALFSLTAIGHLGQSLYYKIYWLIPTMVACALCETIGWSGRLWSSKNPALRDPFLMQITTTIIAPSFMTAAMFIILGQIISFVGTEYSRLKPRTYSIIFITADVLALTIQAAGGGIASSAEDDDPHGAERGAQIMVGGIIVQMAAVTIYALLALEYFIRVYQNRPLRPRSPAADGPTFEKAAMSTVTPKIRLMIIGLAISTVFIYVRSVYRTIELLDGWNGSIISNQLLFNLLDGMPIVVAMFSLNVFHPGYLLPRLVPNHQNELSQESTLA